MLKIWGRVNSINVQKVMWAVGELEAFRTSASTRAWRSAWSTRPSTAR